jgi:hypothetical protein
MSRIDLSETSAKSQTLKNENILWTAKIPIKIKEIELTSDTIHSLPWAASINLPATKGKNKSVKEENNKKTSPNINLDL